MSNSEEVELFHAHEIMNVNGVDYVPKSKVEYLLTRTPQPPKDSGLNRPELFKILVNFITKWEEANKQQRQSGVYRDYTNSTALEETMAELMKLGQPKDSGLVPLTEGK